MPSGPTVMQGAGAKLAAEVAGRLLQFGLAYYAQVTLGAAGYGHLVVALAAGLILSQVADAGLQLTVTREMARYPERASACARAGLRERTWLSALAVLAAALFAGVRPPGVQLATWAVAAAVILGSFVEFAGFALRGLHRVPDDARLSLAFRTVTAAAGSAVLAFGFGLTGLAVGLLASSALCGAMACVWLLTCLPRQPRHEPDRAASLLLRQSWPLGFAIVLSAVYTRVPTFVLDAVAGSAAAGIFGVAQRLIEPAAMLPAAWLAAAFPALVRDRVAQPLAARLLRRHTTAGLAVLGAGLAVVAIAAAPAAIGFLYRGLYRESVAPLQILAVAMMFSFANYALTHLIVAADGQARLLRLNTVVLATAVVGCLVLVPRFGPAGAAAAVVLSEAVLLGLCLWTRSEPPGERLTQSAPGGRVA